MAEFIKFVGNDAKLTEKFLHDHPNFEKLIVNDAKDEKDVAAIEPKRTPSK